MKVLRTTRGEGSGAPGTVLDNRLTIACGDGAVRILELQRAGKQPMKADEFLRGTRCPGSAVRLNHAPLQASSSSITARHYFGWQYQADGPSIQGAIEAAIERFANEKVTIQGAGRTDAGVHALGQVAHFDIAGEHDGGTVRDALNFYLRPQPIAILRRSGSLSISTRGFPPRAGIICIASAIAARISRSSSGASGGSAVRLTLRRCRTPAQRLLGNHDFTTFRSTECQAKSPMKTLDQLDAGRRARNSTSWSRRVPSCTTRCAPWSDRWCMSVKGNGAPMILSAVLAARDRTACGQVAPPEGLYLVKVDY